MKRATIHHASPDATVLPVISTVTLAYDDRHRRRIKMTADNGEDFLLDLAQATYLAEGDLLELEDGKTIMVKAALEDVLEVTPKDIEATARIAWHIGNRHMPIQILADGKMRLRYDHVLEHMIEVLGGACEKKTAAFAPEPGAYKAGGGHGHAHH
ncbi:urease accessory protein UreE [Terasakiella sp. A23]|uniref:urease accessory protein UreE n=1 Tax=Terasakiella sp. FCG-A23 TaxID=3080561 RepID=UPI002952E18E|nr:urease accessory protein UreE [Terasakiella sp. A23]MDV7339584.1 urease accessory protein UreE [Terasakiella sp. A23]